MKKSVARETGKKKSMVYKVRGLFLNEQLIKIRNIMENTHRVVVVVVTSFTLVSRVNDFPLTWTGPFHLFMLSLISFSSDSRNVVDVSEFSDPIVFPLQYAFRFKI